MRSILLLLLLLPACAPAPQPAPADGAPVQGAGPEDLAEARERWAAAAAADYALTIRRSCFCPPEYSGPYRITVRAGVISEATREGQRVDAAQLQIPTVAALFDEVERAYANDAATVRVTYDGHTGHPLEIWIDQDEGMADEEVGYTVSEFTAD